MNAPLSIGLPPGPAAVARAGGPGRGAASRGPEAFDSALQDALTGTTARERPTTGRADEPSDPDSPDGAGTAVPETPATEEQTDDATPAPGAGEVPPGLWALLTAGIGAGAGPSAGPAPDGPPGPHPTAVAAASGTVPGEGAATQVRTGWPGLPDGSPSPVHGPVAAPASDGQPPAAEQVRGASAEALARAHGLTVVTAPGTVPGTAPLDAAATAPALDPASPAIGGATAETAGSGTGPDTDTGADDAATGAPLPPLAPGSAAAPSSPAAGPAAAARETPVAAQLAPQLAVLRNAPDGSQTMTVVLTPDSLGEVTVQVTVTDGKLDLMLRGGSEHGRHALAEALPELRRELEGAGLAFSRLAVDPDAPRDGGAGSRTAEQLLADLRGNGGGQQQGQAPARSRAWVSPGTPLGEGTTPAASPSASPGVDVRV